MSKDVLLKVCKIVSDEVGVTPKVLRSQSRKQQLVFGRMIFVIICRNKFNIKTNDIADYFGLTVGSIYAYLKNCSIELKHNAGFRKDYESILERINKNKALTKGVKPDQRS